jgi:transglutaminase-like putative cysteine protease
VAAFFIMSAAALTPVFAHDSKPAVAPPSKWVVPVRTDGKFNLDPSDPSTSLRWVLVERQINAKNDEQFFHWVRQVLTPDGVQKASHIAIEYDPSYESLTMHWVKIWRGTNALNCLDPSRILTSQRGLATDDFLFSAERPATLLLDDVRPGDIIDYAYSIEGSNPALDGMFTYRVPLQFEEPVDHLVTRLLWPPPRKFYVQNHGTDIYPTTAYRSNMVEFTWDATKVPGLRLQPPTPIWYNPYPWVQLSEYQKWSDVNKWALRLFTTSNPLSPELARKIDDWKLLPGQEDRALAALQFVQEQIRHTGPDSGATVYEPATPSTIFARRFGDCKDKTWLLVTLLRSLDIDAYPVLVNTRARQTVADLHPSPVVFDHAIVQATINNQYYFLDSTAAYERGPLAVRSWPNYGYGLLIRPGVTALREIPPCPVLPKTTVTAYFRVGGLNEESDVRIVTVAEGADAEALREHFSTTPPDEIEREFYHAQARYYSEISSTAPLQFTDDEQNNRIQITEFYSIARMWSRLPEEAYYHCHFYSVNVDDAMRKPDVSGRTMPLGIDYPVHQVSRVEASWATGWPVQPDNHTIENPAFSFYRTENFIGTNLVIEHEYRSLSDVVAPEAVPTYLRQLDAAIDFLGCTVVSY